MPSPLAALSPLDGRYARIADPLRAYFSEQALIRYRVRIELAWLEALEPSPLHLGPATCDLGAGVQELRASRAGTHRFFFGVVRRIGASWPEERHFSEGLELELADDSTDVVRMPVPDAELVAEVLAHIQETENQ